MFLHRWVRSETTQMDIGKFNHEQAITKRCIFITHKRTIRFLGYVVFHVDYWTFLLYTFVWYRLQCWQCHTLIFYIYSCYQGPAWVDDVANRRETFIFYFDFWYYTFFCDCWKRTHSFVYVYIIWHAQHIMNVQVSSRFPSKYVRMHVHNTILCEVKRP